MDINIIVSFLIAIILIILIDEFSTAIPLVVLGFLTLIFALNVPDAFGLDTLAYTGWGNTITLIYVIISLFAFMKTFYSGLEIFKGKKHEQ